MRKLHAERIIFEMREPKTERTNPDIPGIRAIGGSFSAVGSTISAVMEALLLADRLKHGLAVAD